MDKHQVEQVRRFNRTVTQNVGALEETYLRRGRPLGEARLLHEIRSDGRELRLLRERLRLDSGYLSRLLRSLEAQGLVRTEPRAGDGRVRRVVLTQKGAVEQATYNALSNDLAWSLLEPLDFRQRERLVTAMAEVERLLRAGAVEVRLESPDSPTAQWCLEQYFTELAARFEQGFNPAQSNPASQEDMTPPLGYFALARLDGDPVGCAVLKVGKEYIGEIKRMWTAPSARGLGIARRVLQWLEARARDAGLDCLRLETNRSLIEAQALYRAEGYVEVKAFNAEPYAHHWFEKQL